MKDFRKFKDIGINFSEPEVLPCLYKEDYWLEKIRTIREVFGFKSRVNIKAVDSVEELSDCLGVKAPSWVIGAYCGNYIFMLKYELWQSRNLGTFAQVMTHEFTHIAINSKLKQRCPVWLNEGLALYFAEQYKTIRLKRENISKEDIYEIDYLDNCLYDISAKAVEKLADTYGITAIVKSLGISTDFAEDKILGVENMKRILSEMKNSSTQ